LLDDVYGDLLGKYINEKDTIMKKIIAFGASNSCKYSNRQLAVWAAGQ